MFFLIALVLAFGFAFAFAKSIKKKPIVFYILAVALCVFSAVVDVRSLPQWIGTYVAPFFTKSLFATGLWAVVMWAGAFPNGSKPIKILMPIRGELSIIAAILTLGHNIGYGRIYFVRLFTSPSKLPINQLTAGIFTLIMLAIMIPLTIISFKSVRKKINPKTWKKIQRFAYLFYALLYAHVMVLCVPMAKMGRAGYFANVIVYSIVFVGYAVCRVRKQFVKKTDSEDKNFAKINVISSVVFAVAVLAVAFAFKPQKQMIATSADVYSSVVDQNSSVSILDSSSENSSFMEFAESFSVSDNHSSSSKTDSSSKSSKNDKTSSLEFKDSSFENSKQDNHEEAAQSQEQQQEQSQEQQEQEQPQEQQPQEDNNQAQENYEQPQETSEQPEEQPQYIYNNGTYTAKAYGFDGNVEVSVTIENDVITTITGSSEESDTWYFDSAKDFVINQILQNQNTQVDAYSGATYSSNAIMSAVAQAMESAKR